MRKSILAVCDEEQAYAYHFMDYLGQSGIGESFPFEVQIFTDADLLEQFGSKRQIAFLLISQPLYQKKQDWQAAQVIVLAEAGEVPPGIPWVSKYQPVEAIIRSVMETAAMSGLLPPAVRPGRAGGMKLIGVYSPVRRCLQTTFSFTMGQLLARKHKVLYLNFENCSGLARMLQREFQTDLSDLIYFLHNGDGRFPYHLEGMAQKLNGLDFIPPAFSGQDLAKVEKSEWLALFGELEQYGLYEYVILDLSEGIQGLFDILQVCTKVYTIVREDSFAQAKQEQYEELLRCLDCADVLESTRKCRLPLFRSLPGRLEDLTRGELATLVAELIEEDLKD